MPNIDNSRKISISIDTLRRHQHYLRGRSKENTRCHQNHQTDTRKPNGTSRNNNRRVLI